MHTPRPWREVNTGNHQGLIVSEETGENIAVAYDKANARLIAAAPELLEAAQLVIDSWSSGDLAAAVRQLADAVAEATGD